jgi:porphobilinogen synthase
MPNVSRYSVDLLVSFLKPLVEKGLTSVLIFGIIEDSMKDEIGTYAGGLEKESAVHKALRVLGQNFPSLCLITDVCLCAYTSHGHCGVLKDTGDLDNDASVKRLA